MNRRQFLAGVGTVTGFLLAGTPEPPRRSRLSDSPNRDRATATGAAGADVTGAVTSLSASDLPVPESELVRAAPRDRIPAITDPAFGDDWSGVRIEGYSHLRGEYEVEPRLEPWDEVIGIEREGEARAYPLKLLSEHEVVNDTFGEPLLVTFCPLCGSSIAARRTVDGRETIFGVSGLLYNWDLVMYDAATDSKWSQLAATAIRGPRTGDVFDLVPSTLTRWETWRESHPDTRVLRPPPDSNTIRGRVTFDYELDRYAAYEANEQIGLGNREFEDDRLHPKTRVIGVATEDETRAYPFPAVEKRGVINDTVGDLPVVVAIGPGDSPSVSSGELFAYDRRVGGQLLRYEHVEAGRMRAGGSTWNVPTGRAVDGPFRGQQLTQAGPADAVFWFAWLDFHPDTEVYGTDA